MRTERWEIDSSHSSVHFSVRHLVIAKVRGTFARWSGTVQVPDGDFSKATVAVTIDASSIDTGVASGMRISSRRTSSMSRSIPSCASSGSACSRDPAPTSTSSVISRSRASRARWSSVSNSSARRRIRGATARGVQREDVDRSQVGDGARNRRCGRRRPHRDRGARTPGGEAGRSAGRLGTTSGVMVGDRIDDRRPSIRRP